MDNKESLHEEIFCQMSQICEDLALSNEEFQIANVLELLVGYMKLGMTYDMYLDGDEIEIPDYLKKLIERVGESLGSKREK